MRSAVFTSSILALSLFCSRAAAGFPYHVVYPPDARDARVLGQQFGSAAVPHRLPPAIHSASPAAQPKWRTQQTARIGQFPVARPPQSSRPQLRIAQAYEYGPNTNIAVPHYNNPAPSHGNVVHHYGAPAPDYGAPAANYGRPASHHDVPYVPHTPHQGTPAGQPPLPDRGPLSGSVPPAGPPLSDNAPTDGAESDGPPFPSTTPYDAGESTANESSDGVVADAIVDHQQDRGHEPDPTGALGHRHDEFFRGDVVLHPQTESQHPVPTDAAAHAHASGNCTGECYYGGECYHGGGYHYGGNCYDTGGRHRPLRYRTGGGHGSTRYDSSLSSVSWGCGPVIPSKTKNCPTWFGGLYGLVMTRDGDEDVYFLANGADPSQLYFRSNEFETGYSGGIEARVGRTFNCCRWGLEAVYWGLFPDIEWAQFTGAGMTTVLDYANVFDALGTPLANYTDAMVYGRARRFEEYHNFEINLLSGPLTLLAPSGCCDNACGRSYRSVVGYDGGYGGGTYRGAGYPTYGGSCYGSGYETRYRRGHGDGYGPGYYGQGLGNRGCTQPRWMANWVFGVRYFKFNEQVLLDYSSVAPQITGVTGEVYHDYDAENNLVGIQLGVDLSYCLTRRLNLDFGSKFGLFGNHASSRQRIHTPDGLAYVLPANPTDFDIHSSEDNVAFLGELRVGLGCRVGRHLRFTGGYRAIAAAGVATALGQKDFGRELGALGKVADVDSDDSIVLHGAYVGSEFAW